jgi:hypothetical protein
VTAPTRGQFTLHARAVPPLKAGDYVLSGAQDVARGAVAPYEGHVRIDSPRFVMPPDQILSTFPPANAEGAFENRLPQIVLKRRTLPWDRRAEADAPDAMPWLALVVIAEGEGQLSGETPVAQCLTPGEPPLHGPADVPTSTFLAVSQTVLDAVFPTTEDVALLSHVRQVDPSDTELSLGDDDGFLAVVMANRLPQYHRSTGADDPDRPVRYLACLINLEGQLKYLPRPTPLHLSFDAVVNVQNLAALATPIDTDHYVMGGISARTTTFAPGAPQDAAPDGAAHALDALTIASQVSAPPARPIGVSTTSRTNSASAWATAPATVAEVAVSAAPEEAGRLVRDTMGIGWRYNVAQLVAERVYRFPVLAHWSFTVTGSGSFEALMQNLDVGLLGTAPPAPEPPPDGTPPAPPRTRPEPELTDTGHVGLAHRTRRGDASRAWYRGPLSPRPAGADPEDPTVRLPLAHASDQLRRITPDGREDLSLAAAFEIGRLLALSQPAVVAAQLRWRREQFGASRVRHFTSSVLEGLEQFGLELLANDRTPELGRLISRRVVLAAAGDPVTVLGPTRPLADEGRPIDLDGDVDEIVATGFGIPLDAVRAASGRLGVLAALRQTGVPGDDGHETGFDERAAAQVRTGLTATVEQVFRSAAGGRPGPQPMAAHGAQAAAAPDVLDQLIEQAARRRLGTGARQGEDR